MVVVDAGASGRTTLPGTDPQCAFRGAHSDFASLFTPSAGYKRQLMIELQWHAVSGGSNHTLLRITSDDQVYFKGKDSFQRVDGNKQLYVTVGAGPVGENCSAI